SVYVPAPTARYTRNPVSVAETSDQLSVTRPVVAPVVAADAVRFATPFGAATPAATDTAAAALSPPAFAATTLYVYHSPCPPATPAGAASRPATDSAAEALSPAEVVACTVYVYVCPCDTVVSTNDVTPAADVVSSTVDPLNARQTLNPVSFAELSVQVTVTFA